jgi:hypothetical protein
MRTATTTRRAYILFGAVVAMVGTAAGGVFYRVTLPPDKIVLDTDCSVRGINRVSADIHGSGFWETQLEAIENERSALSEQPAKVAVAMASVTAIMQKFEAETDQIEAQLYREHPELAPSPAEKEAANLRKRADDLDRQNLFSLINEARVRRIDWLNSCEPVVRRWLSDGDAAYPR